MNVDHYIVSESLRQSATVTETVGMHKAWAHLVYVKPSLTEETVKFLSGMITGNFQYRKVPAVFNQGMPALAPGLIPKAMSSWAVGISHDLDPNDDAGMDPRLTADYWTKEFLDIHPFADGNGRVGSLIWNYLMGTLNDPEPMPYFYGEAPV